MLEALQTAGLADHIRGWPWAYPLLSTAHISGFALLLGSIIVLDAALVVPRAACGINSSVLQALTLPWALIGFTLAISSGCLMFMADAVAVAANPAFQVKAVLIILAVLNAGQLHLSRAWRTVHRLETTIPMRERISALASAAFWLGIIAAGRLIAFV